MPNFTGISGAEAANPQKSMQRFRKQDIETLPINGVETPQKKKPPHVGRPSFPSDSYDTWPYRRTIKTGYQIQTDPDTHSLFDGAPVVYLRVDAGWEGEEGDEEGC